MQNKILAYLLIAVTSFITMPTMASINQCPTVIACQQGGPCNILDGTPGSISDWGFTGAGGVYTYSRIVRAGSINGLLGVDCYYNNSAGHLYKAPMDFNINNPNYQQTPSGLICNGSASDCRFNA